MIHVAVTHIVDELNNYFKVKLHINDRIIQSNLLQQDGQLSQGLDQKVVLSVVNIEEDRISRSVETKVQQPDGSFNKLKPEIRLNLYLLFIANFPLDYNEALKSISGIISFFQRKNFIDQSNTPGLDPGIKRMVFELYSLTLEQQNHLWGSMGAKYYPSVLYKMRIISIQEEEIDEKGLPIKEIEINSKDKNA